MEDKHAVGLSYTDHVDSAAIPARPLKVQIPSTRFHQILCSLYTQPGRPVPATTATIDKLVCADPMHRPTLTACNNSYSDKLSIFWEGSMNKLVTVRLQQ